MTFTAPLTLTHFRPTQTGWLSQQELAHLDLFRHELIYSIVGPTGTPAWKRLILQAVHEEVALCHAVVAFSALGSNNTPSMSSMDSPSASESSMSTPPPSVSSRENEFALRHYGKALEAMRHVYHYNDRRSINTALLCTLLCICFELRIREPAIALTHLEHGLQVIDSNLQSSKSSHGPEVAGSIRLVISNLQQLTAQLLQPLRGLIYKLQCFWECDLRL